TESRIASRIARCRAVNPSPSSRSGSEETTAGCGCGAAFLGTTSSCSLGRFDASPIHHQSQTFVRTTRRAWLFLSDPGGKSRPYVRSKACSTRAYADPGPPRRIHRGVAMSTATEYAPSVRIPDRARPRRTAAVVLPFPCDRVPRAVVVEATPLRVAVAPRGEARPIRLTRRGWAVAVLAVGIALAGALWLAHSSAIASSAPHRSPPSTVVVRPDDTLWSIATRIAPDRDPRAVVSELEQRNDLTRPTVHVGQVLRAR